MDRQHRILCIEDDLKIGTLLTDQLRELGYGVDWSVDSSAGWERFGASDYELVILDLMLPSIDGLEICRRIRRRDGYTPILMFTAKASLQDVVLGLELGADEYITKPFRVAELVARIRALFRRLEVNQDNRDQQSAEPVLQRGAITIDTAKHRATLHGERVALTAKEFALLATFARHPGRSFSRGALLDEMWGPEFDGFDHTVNTHINRLRNQIEADPASPRYILTVWGSAIASPSSMSWRRDAFLEQSVHAHRDGVPRALAATRGDHGVGDAAGVRPLQLRA